MAKTKKTSNEAVGVEANDVSEPFDKLARSIHASQKETASVADALLGETKSGKSKTNKRPFSQLVDDLEQRLKKARPQAVNCPLSGFLAPKAA